MALPRPRLAPFDIDQDHFDRRRTERGLPRGECPEFAAEYAARYGDGVLLANAYARSCAARTEYTLVLAQPRVQFADQSYAIDQILLIEKNRPAKLAGKFCLPGGRVEPGETVEQCARRELREETGLTAGSVAVAGRLITAGAVISCCVATVAAVVLGPRTEETERVFWTPWSAVLRHPQLIPNLRVIVPLLLSGLTGWEVSDRDRSAGTEHIVAVTIPTFRAEEPTPDGSAR